MPDTFYKIASVTVGSGGAATIDFTSIPATYTDLCVKLSVRNNRATVGASMLMKINTSSADFTTRVLYGSGSSRASTSSSTGFVAYVDGGNETASTFSNTEIYLPNYAGSSNKSYSVDSVEENNATEAYAMFTAGLWSQTTAINGLSFYDASAGTISQYSTAVLYGIKNS